MGDLTGHEFSKAYLEDCGIWPMPPIVNFNKKWPWHHAMVNSLLLSCNFTMGGIG